MCSKNYTEFGHRVYDILFPNSYGYTPAIKLTRVKGENLEILTSESHPEFSCWQFSVAQCIVM